MFRRMLLVMMCVLMAVAAPAQVGGGLSLSGVASQIDGDSWGGYEKVGVGFGGFAWFMFNDRVGIQPEIAFGHRGSREVVGGFGQFSLNFIDIPVMLRIKAYEKDPYSLVVEAGPSADILLSARNGFKPYQVDNTAFFSRYNAEAHVGLAGYFQERVGLFLRWSVGLNNLWAYTPRPWMTIHYFSAGLRFGFIGGR